jgi:hypothetical protein
MWSPSADRLDEKIDMVNPSQRRGWNHRQSYRKKVAYHVSQNLTEKPCWYTEVHGNDADSLHKLHIIRHGLIALRSADENTHAADDMVKCRSSERSWQAVWLPRESRVNLTLRLTCHICRLECVSRFEYIRPSYDSYTSCFPTDRYLGEEDTRRRRSTIDNLRQSSLMRRLHERSTFCNSIVNITAIKRFDARTHGLH